MTKMTSYSTSSSQSDKLIPNLLSQERHFEPQEASFFPKAVCYDYAYGDFKSLQEKDENFRAFIPHMEALKRAKSVITKILQDKAEKNKREEDTDSTDSEDSTESENDKADESVVIAIGLHPETNESRLSKMELRSFIFKRWLRRIELTKNED